MKTLDSSLFPGSDVGRSAGALRGSSCLGGRRTRVLLRVVAAAVGAATVSAQDFRAGTVAERYALLCANCHGRNLEGSGTGHSEGVTSGIRKTGEVLQKREECGG